MEMINDSFFWFSKNDITIPGVSGEHLFMHITDTHLSVWDGLSSEEDITKAKEQEARWMKGKENFARSNGEPFGEAQEISCRKAFEKLLSLAGELRPEALLLSGDNLDYTHPAGERYLADRLGKYPGRFICVPGNHESDQCPGVWTRGVRGYDFKGFRIAAVDDRLKTVSEDDLTALKRLCAEECPIIVLCHIPLMTEYCRDELKDLSSYFFIDQETEDDNAREFVRLLTESDTVKAVVCGHVHGYHKCELSPGKPQIIGSQGMAGAVDLIMVKGE